MFNLGPVELFTVLFTVLLTVTVLLAAGIATRSYRRREADRIVDRFVKGIEIATARIDRASDIAVLREVIENTGTGVRELVDEVRKLREDE